MADLTFAPGISQESTPLDVGQGFYDSNLIRWRKGKFATVGGWETIQGVSATGVCRALHEWSDNAGAIRLGIGTNSKLQIYSYGTIYDVTPSGFTAGPVDAAVPTGYGIAGYGEGTFGTTRTPVNDPFSALLTQPLLWHLDNFGEDLIANPRGGPIYYWSSASGFSSPAVLLSKSPLASGVPPLSNGAFVNIQLQTVVAVGCVPFGGTNVDPMQIRWSDDQNPYQWTPASSNNAGGYRLPSGSSIIAWLPTYYETLFFTDKTIYSMQLVQNGDVYGFPAIAQGMSIISPNAAITNGSAVFWMDRGSFYVYSGSVNELPCTLKDYVFKNINLEQAWKVFAAHFHSFSEVWWFYVSSEATEIDSYVSYNYAENLWAKGKLSRTAWSDPGRLTTPVATDSAGNIYLHETGVDQVNGASTTALPWYIDTGDLNIDGGETFTLLKRVIPDFQWNGSTATVPSLALDVRVRNSSEEAYKVVGTKILAGAPANKGYTDLKARGRRVSLRMYNHGATGTALSAGKLQVFFQPNGKR